MLKPKKNPRMTSPSRVNHGKYFASWPPRFVSQASGTTSGRVDGVGFGMWGMDRRDLSLTLANFIRIIIFRASTI